MHQKALATSSSRIDSGAVCDPSPPSSPHRPALARLHAALIGLSAWCGLVLTATPVAGQQAPYANYLVGERALGLSGAFVAVADDPSAIFHNPAGLASLSTAAISGSLWAVAFRDREVTGGLVTPGGSDSLSFGSTSSLPLFLGAVVKFGAEDERGYRKHALGFSILRPYSDEYRYRGRVQGEAGTSVHELNVIHDDSSLWFGLGYAYQLAPRLSLGGSLFVARRSIDHEEAELSVLEAGAPLLGRLASAEASHMHAIIRLGALYTPNSQWSLGAMLQAPGIGLWHSATVDSTRPEDASGGMSSGFVRESGAVDAHAVVPWEARVGASYRPGASTLVTLDLSLLGGAGDSGRAQLASSELVYSPSSTKTDLALRLAAGFEWVVSGVVPLRGGLLWEGAKRPELPAVSDRYLGRRMSTVGGSLSVGFRAEGFNFALGTTLLFGAGEAMAVSRSDALRDLSYARASASDRTIIVYLSGASSVAKVVAQEIVPVLSGDD